MDIEGRYLTINQLAKACSISRSSILRMEKDGILEPAFINQENGYRYYNTDSVLRVTRNISLQELGLTHKELKKYYSEEGNYHELLHKLLEKMKMMEYHIESLKTQLKLEEHLSINKFYFPELYCYTYEMKNVTDLSSVRPNIWVAFSKAVDEGYAVDRRMHPFVLIDYVSMKNNNYENKGYDYTICIPVIGTGREQTLKHFPATDSVSAVLYGGAEDMQKAMTLISEEIEKNKLPFDDQARVISLVNSYPGENIPFEYWAIRVSVPVKKYM